VKDEHPLVVELTKMQYDLTSLKARLSEIQRQFAALRLTAPEPGRFECFLCGVRRATDELLADHLANVHGQEERCRTS